MKYLFILKISGLLFCSMVTFSNSTHAAERPCELFVPPPDEFDWIQLTSGEWLKGELKALYNQQLEFDSDQLDTIEFDMEDVKQVRGHGVKSVRVQRADKLDDTGRPAAITVHGEYFRDPFQNIEGRYTAGTAIGYHLIFTAKTEWDVTAGLAYQGTQFVSVLPGQDLNISTPVLSIGTLHDTNIAKKIEFSIRKCLPFS